MLLAAGERIGAKDALAFFDANQAVRRDVGEGLGAAVGPAYFQRRGGGRAEPKMEAEIIDRVEARLA